MKEVSESVSNFASYTSAVGPARIKDSTFTVQRLLWLLVICGALGMAIWKIYELSIQFHSQKIATKLKINYGETNFPVLRICNLNPIKYSKLFNNQRMRDILAATARAFNTDIPLPTNGGPYTVPVYNESSVNSSLIKSIDDAKRLLREEIFYRYGEDLTPTHHQLITGDMLVHCLFKNLNCFDSFVGNLKITSVFNYFYGTCEYFHMNLPVSLEGPSGGLEMILDIGMDEYVPLITDAAGITVSVLHKAKGGGEAAIRLSPGFFANIVITETKSIKLPVNDKCTLSPLKDWSYTECQETCRSTIIANECQCSYDISFIRKLCVTKSERRCYKGILSNFDYTKHCPECQIPCLSTQFKTKVTVSKWPSLGIEPIVKKYLSTSGKHNVSVGRSTLAMRVYFSSLTTTTYEEEFAYTEENFLSDIGGQFGLWIGLSVLSLGEFAELLILILLAVRQRKKRESRVEEFSLNKC